jgi:transposase
VIFNLPGCRVVDAVALPLGGRQVRVQPVDLADGCPSCGVISARVHAWIVQRVRDIPYAGQLEVVVRKPRLVCAEPACPRGTFTPATEQLPVRARCTTRLRTALLSAVIDSGRAVAEVAADHDVAWWTVQATVNAAAVLLPNVDELHVRRLGIDEHRYRRVAGSATQTVVAGGGSSRGCRPSSTPTAARSSGSWTAATPPPSAAG